MVSNGNRIVLEIGRTPIDVYVTGPRFYDPSIEVSLGLGEPAKRERQLSYDAADEGCFGKHRDTIDPYLHRRFAMSVILNEDFEGGGICFPECSDEIISAPKYSAIIFPGSLYHQVMRIGAGRRYVIISFLFSAAEAGANERSESYRFTVKRDLAGLTINRLSPATDD